LFLPTQLTQKQAGYAAAPSKCLHMMLSGFITSLVTLDIAHSKFPIKALNFESTSVTVESNGDGDGGESAGDGGGGHRW
jgi:hypothetical protein